MQDWPDEKILTPEDLAAYYGVNKRTLLEWVRDGRGPQPIGGRKPPFRWRWGAVKKWHDAMETLYGVGWMSAGSGQKTTKNDENLQNSAREENEASHPKKRA